MQKEKPLQTASGKCKEKSQNSSIAMKKNSKKIQPRKKEEAIKKENNFTLITLKIVLSCKFFLIFMYSRSVKDNEGLKCWPYISMNNNTQSTCMTNFSD